MTLEQKNTIELQLQNTDVLQENTVQKTAIVELQQEITRLKLEAGTAQDAQV